MGFYVYHVLIIYTLQQDTASSSQSVKPWQRFHLVRHHCGSDQCWIVRYVSISAYKSMSWSLTLWRRYSSYSFFYRERKDGLTPNNASLLLPVSFHSHIERDAIPFWSWPPPERTPVSPAAAFSVCLTELVESCRRIEGNLMSLLLTYWSWSWE